MTLSVASLSAELAMLDACNDTDLALFKVIAIQTDPDRSVVSAVLEQMQGEAPPGHQDCFIDCKWQWLDPFCPPVVPTHWGQVNACCVAGKYDHYCLDICWCSADPEEECLERAFRRLMATLQGCFEEAIDGVQAVACP
jgi:hypothetical protein